MLEIEFYKEEDRWYANLPEYIAQGGTKEQCEMVAGADKFLDKLAKGNDKVMMMVSDQDPKRYTGYLRKFYSDEYGADYLEYPSQQKMWLCAVTKWLFWGGFPETIWYKLI